MIALPYQTATLPTPIHRLCSLLAAPPTRTDITKIDSKLRHMRKDKATQIAELFFSVYLQLTQMCVAQLGTAGASQ